MVTANQVEWLKAAHLSATCPWWERALARILGKKIVGHDGKFAVQGYAWRGKVYMTAFD